MKVFWKKNACAAVDAQMNVEKVAVCKRIAKRALAVPSAVAGGLAPAAAFAQSNGSTAPGWGQALNNVGQLVDNAQTLMLIVCAFIGVCCFIYCGMQIWKKSKPEHARDVTMNSIVLSAVAGTFFMAISLVIANSVTTIGGSSSNIGQRTVYNGTNN